MSYNDIITNEQKIVKVFTDAEVEQILSDENHRQLLQFLFRGPLTVEDLEIAYQRNGNEKSDKSIYRYLGKLKKAGLIIEAGKRIFTDDENQIKTHTLFSRAAKIIFTPLKRLDRQEDLETKSYKILNIILQEKLGFKNQATKDCIKSKTNAIITKKNDSIAKFFESTDNKELLELVEDFEIHELYPVLDLVGWIILFEEHPEMLKEFVKCFR